MASADSLENPSGDSSENGGQIGNLGLTDEEEDHIVAFLRTLSDGFFVNELPAVIQQPNDAAACPGGVARFSAGVSGTPTLFYQWYLGTTQLADGQQISGSETPTLVINPVGPGDVSSQYRCVVRNVAGEVSTEDALLALLTAGSGDGNGDGRLNGRDIRGLIDAVISGASSGLCAYDMNVDGAVGESDVNLFVTALLSQ